MSMPSLLQLVLICLLRNSLGLDGEEDFPIVYVVFGPKGIPIARAIVASGEPCPEIELPYGYDEHPTVSERFAGNTAMPHAFPVKVCEASLPKELHKVYQKGAATATFGDKELPNIVTNPDKFVIFGSTGLRVKAGDSQTITEWPARDLAQIATDFDHPDVVIHVGGYNFRQGPCPDAAGCNEIGDQWGDNWKGWYADFFQPLLPLLSDTPWIFTRGSHENCANMGRGWFLFLDPRPLRDGWKASDCLDQTDAYKVPFDHEQFLVVDTSILASSGIESTDISHTCSRQAASAEPLSRFLSSSKDTQISTFKDQFKNVEEMEASHATNFLVSHLPLYGVACDQSTYVTLDWTLQQALKQAGRKVLQRVVATLHGHLHFFEGLVFDGHKLPAQIVVGNSGTKLSPDTVNQGISGLRILGHPLSEAHVTSKHGYVLMERQGHNYQISARHGPVDGMMQEHWSTQIDPGPRLRHSSHEEL